MGIYRRTPDVVIRNGCIVDGTGRLPYYADVAIVGDKIDYIGDLKGVKAKLIDIDAHHKYVTPGFIDTHSHADFTIWGCPTAQTSTRQGITTEVIGHCGASMRTKMTGVQWDEAGDGIDCVYNLPGPDYPRGAMAATLDKAEKMGASINTSWYCGHNSLRMIAGCYQKECSQEQFKMMGDFLREAMEAGFAGFSTGLDLIPGVYSTPEEVERLAMIAAEYDANYTSHMRDEGTYLLEAVNEFLNVIRKTGMRGTASHMHLKYHNGTDEKNWGRAVEMLRKARDVEHLNVYTDMLPTTFATGGAFAILPPWLYENGWEEAKKMLADPATRERIKADCNRYWRFLAAGEWDRLLFMQADYMPQINTVPFAELVKRTGKDSFDCFLDVVAQAPTMEDMINTHIQGNVFREQDLIDTLIKDPLYMWMTDAMLSYETGPLAASLANVQNFMSMTYFFVHYVRDLNVISIEDAVKKVTSVPAHHYMLENRGSLEVGRYADVNVFDLENLKINATFAEPCRYSSGMEYVFVNGVPVIKNGEHTCLRAGKVLRHLPKN